MLTDAKIKAAKARADRKPYKLADAEQLYLYVSAAGGRHWRMNYRWRQKQKTLALGTYPAVTLGEARRKRDQAKDLLREGKDPSLERKLVREAGHQSEDTTFERVARAWHALNEKRWSEHHASDVLVSLDRDVFPDIGGLPIKSIDVPRVRELLRAIERRPAIETARRVRQRMSAVFVYAIAEGLTDADPAAIVRGALAPTPAKGRQPAITDLAGVRQVLIDGEATPAHGVTKLALRLLALTSVRPGELRGARWDELEDMEPRWGMRQGERCRIEQPLWRVPAARMKGDRSRKQEIGGDHLVPLSRQAVDVLEALRPLTGRGPLLFPSSRHSHRPMSENAIGYLLNRAGYHHRHVPHGWRAAFSTIMNERANREGRSADRAVIDLMLAHVPKDKVESAYNRAGFMERRRELAQEWADLLMQDFWEAEVMLGQPRRPPAKIVAIRGAGVRVDLGEARRAAS